MRGSKQISKYIKCKLTNTQRADFQQKQQQQEQQQQNLYTGLILWLRYRKSKSYKMEKYIICKLTKRQLISLC